MPDFITESFKVFPFEPSQQKVWDMLVDESCNGTFIHKRGFMEYHGDRYKDHSLMVSHEGITVAVIPAEEEGGRLFSHRGLTYAGWLILDGLPDNVIHGIIKATINYCKTKEFRSLEVSPVPYFFCQRDQGRLLRAILSNKPEIIKTKIYHATQLPFQFTDRGKKWGWRKATLHNLKVTESGDFESFWNQVLEPHLLAKFQNKPIHSLKEILLLKNRFPENIRLFIVHKEGELMAGTVIFMKKEIVHTQYIASTAKGRKFRAIDLLFRWIMDQFNHNKKYLSLGTSMDGRTNKTIPGLVKWKESLGAKGFDAPEFYWDIEEIN